MVRLLQLHRPVASTKHFKHAHVHTVSMTLLIFCTCELALTSSSLSERRIAQICFELVVSGSCLSTFAESLIV